MTHGRGLFATDAIQRGEIVSVKAFPIFDHATLLEITPLLGPAEIPVAGGPLIAPLRPGERLGSPIFSNHSCDPDIGV